MSNEELQDDCSADSNVNKTLTDIIEVDEKRNADTSSQKKTNNEKNSSAIDTNKTDIRENLVDSAVRFLQNSRVQQRTLADRTSFLLSKGLTENEIQIACTRCGYEDEKDKNNLTNKSNNQSFPINPGYKSYKDKGLRGWWKKFQDFINFVLFLSGSSYAIHTLWKNYLYGMLFGETKKSLTASEETLIANQKIVNGIDRVNESIENVATSLSTHISRVEGIFQDQAEAKVNNYTQASNKEDGTVESLNLITSDLKKEIQSIKGLLLGASRFPGNPTITPISLPQSNTLTSPNTNKIKIPDWQLEDESADKNNESHCDTNTILERSNSRNEIFSSNTSNVLDSKDESTDVDEANNQLKTSSSASLSKYIHQNTNEVVQEDKLEETDQETKNVHQQSTGKVKERIDNKGKTKYRVDPDLLIGYSRRTII